MPEHEPVGDEPVGSLAEEAAKLVAALMSQRFTSGDSDLDAGSDPEPQTEPDSGQGAQTDAQQTDVHLCPHGWCPVCRLAEFIQENPETVAAVMSAASELLRALGEAVDLAQRPRGSS